MQKAFDCVNHDILRRTVGCMGIDSEWFKSYLMGRKQLVKLGNTCSEVSDGVPQGSLLGPVLYLCHSNDMETSASSKILLYVMTVSLLYQVKARNK